MSEVLIPQPEEEEKEIAPASDEVWLALADLLRKKELREGLKKWMDAQADNVPKIHSFKVQHLWLSYLFAVIVLASIILLAVFKIIAPEVMVGLLGPLLGYWFGRNKGN